MTTPGLDVDEALELIVHNTRAPARRTVTSELVGAADELVTAFAATLVARPQTQRTYERACRRFTRWLGPLAGPEDLTAANVGRYHAYLVAGGRASATVKKDRAALNTFCAGSPSTSTSPHDRSATRSPSSSLEHGAPSSAKRRRR